MILQHFRRICFDRASSNIGGGRRALAGGSLCHVYFHDKSVKKQSNFDKSDKDKSDDAREDLRVRLNNEPLEDQPGRLYCTFDEEQELHKYVVRSLE